MAKIKVSRRTFLKTTAGAVAAAGFPAIVPSSVFGQMAPSNRINIGAIGTGRISRGHDMPGIWQFDHARIMAVCDLSAKRVEQAKTLVNGVYAKKTGQALRRRYRVQQLPRVAGQQGYRCRRHLHPRSSARHSRGGCGARGQGRLSAEARLADHRRRPLPQRCRQRLRTNPPDRQPAKVVGAVPHRCRTGAQWSHRRSQARRDRSARRPGRRRCNPHARAC